MNDPQKIFRHGEPTKMDTAPFGSKCITMVGKDTARTYTQCSTDEENPVWELTNIEENKIL